MKKPVTLLAIYTAAPTLPSSLPPSPPPLSPSTSLHGWQAALGNFCEFVFDTREVSILRTKWKNTLPVEPDLDELGMGKFKSMHIVT